MRNTSFSHLLERAKHGDAEAIRQVVDRLEPLVRKYSWRLGYADARSELIEWLLRAIHRYPLASQSRDSSPKSYHKGKATF
jgi:hypothetical protein